MTEGYPLANDPEWLAEKAIDRVWDLAGSDVDMVEVFEVLIENAQSALETYRDTVAWEDAKND